MQNKTVLVTLTEAEYKELEKISFALGGSKSKIMSQALLAYSASLRGVLYAMDKDARFSGAEG